jgi:hypothetical protein
MTILPARGIPSGRKMWHGSRHCFDHISLLGRYAFSVPASVGTVVNFALSGIQPTLWKM